VTEARYPRDLHGYGRNPPDPRWPGGARVAVQFVVNFRVVGRPGRVASLAHFLDYIMCHEKVWVPTRLQIAQHWHAKLSHLAANAFDIGS
jgi:hypothetical protein